MKSFQYLVETFELALIIYAQMLTMFIPSSQDFDDVCTYSSNYLLG
jgi:hypothetical protein